MIIRMAHIGIVVQDIENMVAFYRDVLGLTVNSEREVVGPPNGDHTGIAKAHKKFVFLGKLGDEPLLELIYYINPVSSIGGRLEFVQTNASHLCFNVTNLNIFYEDLRSKGVRFVTPPKLLTSLEGGCILICYAQDPEGNWLEFIEEIK
jgi:catechol 2,3-dioxygenase-like lactoylglutathione lyase family enzyme